MCRSVSSPCILSLLESSLLSSPDIEVGYVNSATETGEDMLRVVRPSVSGTKNSLSEEAPDHSPSSLQHPSKCLQKREPSSAAGEGVNWRSHCGKQYGDS